MASKARFCTTLGVEKSYIHVEQLSSDLSYCAGTNTRVCALRRADGGGGGHSWGTSFCMNRAEIQHRIKRTTLVALAQRWNSAVEEGALKIQR